MTNLIKFQNNELEVININGTPYLRGRQIGDTLQLAKGYRAVQKIFQRHRNEFTPDMMLSIEAFLRPVRKMGSLQEVREQVDKDKKEASTLLKGDGNDRT